MAGLFLLTILPEILPVSFIGILIAVMIYAVGGGLLEVLVSPVVEACPSDNKEKAMSLLHSFYCWGHAGVVLISTMFFYVVGIDNWKILAIIWAVIPIGNAFVFQRFPLHHCLRGWRYRTWIKGIVSDENFLDFVDYDDMCRSK